MTADTDAEPDLPTEEAPFILARRPAWAPLPAQAAMVGPPFRDPPLSVAYTVVVQVDGIQPSETHAPSGSRVSGKDVRSWIARELTYWVSSHATISRDGTIRYRQSPHLASVWFKPDHTSGQFLVDAQRQITADAYRVTGHGRTPQVWSGCAVRTAVGDCLKPKDAWDWPAGWAHVLPQGRVRFAPDGLMNSLGDQYDAEPVSTPASWGHECAACGWYQSEHDPKRWWGPALEGGVVCHRFSLTTPPVWHLRCATCKSREGDHGSTSRVPHVLTTCGRFEPTITPHFGRHEDLRPAPAR